MHTSSVLCATWKLDVPNWTSGVKTLVTPANVAGNEKANTMDFAMYADITWMLHLFRCAELVIGKRGRGKGLV